MPDVIPISLATRAAFTCVMLTAGVLAQSAPTSQPVAPSRQAIDAELAKVVDEILAADPHATDPAGTQPALEPAAARDRLLAQGQSLLDAPASPVLPVNFATLDDAGATKLVTQLDQVFRDFKLEVSPVVHWLLAKQQSDPLSGPRLHLLARLMYGQLDALTRSVHAPTTRGR